MAKKSNPFFQKNVEKQEEKKGKDLDGDGEKGESKAHKAKVFGKSKGKSAPPMNVKMPAKGKALAASGMKKCPTCGQPMPCGQKHK